LEFPWFSRRRGEVKGRKKNKWEKERKGKKNEMGKGKKEKPVPRQTSFFKQ
jgi:hypothetical protein